MCACVCISLCVRSLLPMGASQSDACVQVSGCSRACSYAYVCYYVRVLVLWCALVYPSEYVQSVCKCAHAGTCVHMRVRATACSRAHARARVCVCLLPLARALLWA
jgi:hypothetical protein